MNAAGGEDDVGAPGKGNKGYKYMKDRELDRKVAGETVDLGFKVPEKQNTAVSTDLSEVSLPLPAKRLPPPPPPFSLPL